MRDDGSKNALARALKCGVGAILAFLLSGCVNALFYFPNHEVYQTPQTGGLAYREVSFASGDGTKLSGWFVPAVGRARGTVVHFHGNAQNMTAHFSYVGWLPKQGYNVFVFDYRGYGKSAGRPEREGVFEDCAAALDCARSQRDVDPERLLVFGQSLGGANAIATLGENTNATRGVKGIAIDSAFFSYRSIIRDKINMIPVLSLLRWPLSYVIVSNGHSPGNAIAKLPAGVPLLLLHGRKDSVVPFAHAERLFTAAHEPKDLLLADDCNHTEAIMKSPAYRAALLDFFDRAVAAP